MACRCLENCFGANFTIQSYVLLSFSEELRKFLLEFGSIYVNTEAKLGGKN